MSEGPNLGMPAATRWKSQQSYELVNGQGGLTNDRSQRSLGDFCVIGNGQPAMWCGKLPQYDVTAALTILLIPDLAKRFDRLPAKTVGSGLTG
jgi:hypothetical protein